MGIYSKAVRKDRVSDRCGTLVEVDGIEIAVFRRGEEFFAISNVCSHQHYSKLHEGQLDGFVIECPMHGWKYDLRSGKAISGEGRVPVYAVRVDGEELIIDVPAPE